MIRRLLNELDAPTVKEAVGANEEGVGPFACKSCKCRVDLPAGGGAQELDLQSHGVGSRLRVSFCGLSSRNIGRIDEGSDTGG